MEKTNLFMLFFFSLLIMACQEPEKNISNDIVKEIIPENSPDTNSNDSDTTLSNDEIYEFVEYPDFWGEDLALSVDLLLPGQSHGDEIPEGIESKEWFGLFRLENGGIALRKVSPIKEIIFDPIVDEGTQDSTGVNIMMEDSEHAIIAFSGITNLIPDTLKVPGSIPEEFLVGESHEFLFANTTYRLYATGKENFESNGTGWSRINDYSLFIEEIDLNSRVKKSLLVSRKFFDDSSIRILFIGDLDKDEKLDFLLNVGHKYTAFEPALYLSSHAKENEVVGLVGMRIFTGC